MRNKAIILLVAVVLTGCMIGPNYKRPSVDVPQSWRFEDKEAKDVANTTWWEQFNDPVLNDLIQDALKENKDLKVAAARIEQFVGQMETTRAPLFPADRRGRICRQTAGERNHRSHFPGKR